MTAQSYDIISQELNPKRLSITLPQGGYVPVICEGNDKGAVVCCPVYYQKDAEVEMQCVRHDKSGILQEFCFVFQEKGMAAKLLYILYGPFNYNTNSTAWGSECIIDMKFLNCDLGPDPFFKTKSKLALGELEPVRYPGHRESTCFSPSFNITIGYRVGVGGNQEVFIPDPTDVARVTDADLGKNSMLLYSYTLLAGGKKRLHFAREDMLRVHFTLNEENTPQNPMLLKLVGHNALEEGEWRK